MPSDVRILIAEDEDALRRALAAILRVWGHDVVEARDGREALATATGEDPPDIAILDWDMPILSGIDVCRQLRSKPELPYTYLILLTGKGSRDDRIEGLDAGADDYVVKPFDPRELAARLKTAARILGLRPSSAPIELVFGPPAVEVGTPEEGSVDHAALEATVLVCSGTARVANGSNDARALEPDPLVGRALGGGKYRLLELIGRGAVGFVYEAHHAGLGRTVAVKVLDPLLQVEPDFVARFHREAVATSMLDHPNVMRVIDFGQEADGLAYLAMEYLAGRTLQALLDESGGALRPERAIDVMSQVCSGLAAAHSAGIVHRDVKPENILVLAARDEDGVPVDHVKLCDFGIAKVDPGAEWGLVNDKLTAAGAVWGTPRYMSPEQAKDGRVDARSDIYSCGVVLYQMITGRVPFLARSPLSILAKHVLEEPQRPIELNPMIDPLLDAAILKAMSKDPSARHQTARELRTDLRALLGRARSRDLATQPVEVAAV